MKLLSPEMCKAMVTMAIVRERLKVDPNRPYNNADCRYLGSMEDDPDLHIQLAPEAISEMMAQMVAAERKP